MQERNWKIIDRMILSDREGKYVSFDDLRISVHSTTLLSGSFSTGIYLHQKEAIKSFLEGENICIATGTASGKSLPFYVAAIEKLVANPQTKVIAIYPLKALGREQEERWIQALNSAKVPARVGRIDGQTPMHARMEILRNCQVLIMTPDIIHAWLLFYVGDKSVMNFLASTSLVIVDEVHNYTGVFGSNAAYLFRRMRHIMNLLGASPQFITASATIAAPENHLQNLFGLDVLLEKMAGIMKLRQEELDSNVATAIALEQILACLHQSPEIISMDTTTELSGSGNHLARVILPGSKGLNLRNNNEEYFVESVFYSPQYRGLAYRGCNYEGKHRNGQDVKNIIPVASLVETPGESSCGLYNLETGELTAV
jgi:superfamily II DNA/RNA helicase